MTDKPHDALFKAAFEKPEHAAGIFGVAEDLLDQADVGRRPRASA